MYHGLYGQRMTSTTIQQQWLTVHLFKRKIMNDDKILVPGLGQAGKCGRIKHVNGITTGTLHSWFVNVNGITTGVLHSWFVNFSSQAKWTKDYTS